MGKKTDKYASRPVQIALSGRGAKRMPAAEAVTFARQLCKQKQWPVAAVMMQQVTQQVPNYLAPWLVLFDAYHGMGDFAALARVATRCLNHKPRCVPALVSLATALRMKQRHAEALALIEKAVKLEPANPNVLNHLGIIQKELGQLNAALSTFNRCLTISPQYTEPYWNRSDLLRNPADSDIAAMEALLSNAGAGDKLSANQQARLHYALSRAYEYTGNSEKQFQHVQQGAKCKRESVTYDHTAAIQQITEISTCFNPQLLRRRAEPVPQPSTPIFICGLPRSGTTLAEQILSSHLDVVAGDELTDLPMVCGELLQSLDNKKAFPQWAPDLSPQQWLQIGERYRKSTQSLQSKRFFTDKNLQNYQAIGVIKMALPEAKIIYCQRNPMDNLWGCYRQLFGDGLYFTYSQQELADTWNAAYELTQYWQQQLGDDLFVLDYEELVANQEGMTRKLLEYVGLEWDEACLRFYDNTRAVRTTSAIQVRNPISADRIGQWKVFEQPLQPMRERLINAGVSNR
jgi:tetratricopeptide (TPR) repeat protein